MVFTAFQQYRIADFLAIVKLKKKNVIARRPKADVAISRYNLWYRRLSRRFAPRNDTKLELFADGPDVADLSFQLFVGPQLFGPFPAVGVVDGECFSIPGGQHDVMSRGGKISLAHGKDHGITRLHRVHHLFLHQGQFLCGQSQFSRAFADEGPGGTVALGVIAGLINVCEMYVGKGTSLLVVGKIETREYKDNAGQTRYVTEIVVEDLELLGGKEKEQKTEKPDTQIPF